MKTIRIGTRGSRLALAQTNQVAAALLAAHPGIEIETIVIKTTGDIRAGVPFAAVGTKGMFVKEIEEALMRGDIDIAIHSLKDMPSELPGGLCIAATPPREDARDVIIVGSRGAHRHSGRGEESAFPPAAYEEEVKSRSLVPRDDGVIARDDGVIARDDSSIARDDGIIAGDDGGVDWGGGVGREIPIGARIGTSSMRRQAQLRAWRPDLVLEELRGNVDTRLRKLDEGQYDAIVLACAGLNRLGLGHRITQILPTEISTPAPGQGILALECREESQDIRRMLAPLHDESTGDAMIAERAFQAALNAGCTVPAGAYARLEGEDLILDAMIASTDGSGIIRSRKSGPRAEAARIGQEAADDLLIRGGQRFVMTQ